MVLSIAIVFTFMVCLGKMTLLWHHSGKTFRLRGHEVAFLEAFGALFFQERFVVGGLHLNVHIFTWSGTTCGGVILPKASRLDRLKPCLPFFFHFVTNFGKHFVARLDLFYYTFCFLFGVFNAFLRLGTGQDHKVHFLE